MRDVDRGEALEPERMAHCLSVLARPALFAFRIAISRYGEHEYQAMKASQIKLSGMHIQRT